jgi:aryl-alcohol dehydrogenase-like predicted oxidoreductase
MTTLGRGGPEVSRAGLGLMGMSSVYGAADETESVATIRAALDAGVTLLDTGDFYGMGHNEMLLGRALRAVLASVGVRDRGEPGVRAVHRARGRQVVLGDLGHAGVVRVADVGQR